MKLQRLWNRSIVYIVSITIAAASIGIVSAEYDGEKKDGDVYSERAKRAAHAFMERLQRVLMQELREGGPVQAMTVCADTAQELTRIASEGLGVSLKRISDRARNPDNMPDTFEAEVLDRFNDMHQQEVEPPFVYSEVRTIDGVEEFWFFQSIHLQGQCIGCHGLEEAIAENIKRMINERYPNDSATGYRPGDLRGAVRISFPVNE